MEFKERRDGEVTVLSVQGDILLNQPGPPLADAVRSLLERSHSHIVLDVSHVRYVDSGGLGELVECLTAATHRGGSLALVG